MNTKQRLQRLADVETDLAVQRAVEPTSSRGRLLNLLEDARMDTETPDSGLIEAWRELVTYRLTQLVEWPAETATNPIIPSYQHGPTPTPSRDLSPAEIAQWVLYQHQAALLWFAWHHGIPAGIPWRLHPGRCWKVDLGGPYPECQCNLWLYYRWDMTPDYLHPAPRELGALKDPRTAAVAAWVRPIAETLAARDLANVDALRAQWRWNLEFRADPWSPGSPFEFPAGPDLTVQPFAGEPPFAVAAISKGATE